MKPGGIFGQSALSGTVGQALFGKKFMTRKVRGMGCVCGTGAVVPDDFGVDLLQPSLPVTQEMLDEATALEAENAAAQAAQGSALNLTGTQIALILGAVGIGVYMMTKPKRKMTANAYGVKSSKKYGRKRGKRHARTWTTSMSDAQLARHLGGLTDKRLQGILRSRTGGYPLKLKQMAKRELFARYDLRG